MPSRWWIAVLCVGLGPALFRPSGEATGLILTLLLAMTLNLGVLTAWIWSEPRRGAAPRRRLAAIPVRARRTQAGRSFR